MGWVLVRGVTPGEVGFVWGWVVKEQEVAVLSFPTKRKCSLSRNGHLWSFLPQAVLGPSFTAGDVACPPDPLSPLTPAAASGGGWGERGGSVSYEPVLDACGGKGP